MGFMEQQNHILKKTTAYKLTVKDILGGGYIKKDNEPNYIQLSDKMVYRVNLLGAVVMKNLIDGSPSKSIVIEDFTGRISVRSFENSDMFDNLAVGDLVLIIGKPREFGSERYIIPEILRKIDDTRWLKVREIELKPK